MEICKVINWFFFSLLFSTYQQGLIHEIRITNQVMYLSPPIEEARYQITQQLFAWQRIVIGLRRLESSRYQVISAQFLLPLSGVVVCVLKSVAFKLKKNPVETI